MTKGTQPRKLSAILCADWGKEVWKRAVYVADVESRIVRRLSADGWSVARVLAEAERWTSAGSVLATFDAPIGVPKSYLAAFNHRSARRPEDFLALLACARSLPRFYDATTVARDWVVDRPFFSVPAGDGGLRTYVDAAGRLGVDLYRQIDRMTGAKAVFIKSGVPGSVGSAACALWQELASQLAADRTFKVWPFEGELERLLQSTSVVVGEMYPRAAYATALLDAAPTSRAPKPLLDSHVVSYVPSASVLVFLRNRQTQNAPLRAALAVSASQTTSIASPSSTGAPSPFGAISRGVYDLEATQLPALPSANDEARLVIDLRGNTGGGIGCLRLMSHLCADRRGVGYSVSRAVARQGYDKERLPAFDRIPKSKLGVLPLILRFARARRSVAVFTEALGPQRHHGQVVMLVNEHSASAAEMVAAFASEYRLATLVGAKTPGRLVATSAFKVGLGYRVVLPVAAYFTWHGTNLEGRGVVPNIEEPISPEALWNGEDNQLNRAVAHLNQLASVA